LRSLQQHLPAARMFTPDADLVQQQKKMRAMMCTCASMSTMRAGSVSGDVTMMAALQQMVLVGRRALSHHERCGAGLQTTTAMPGATATVNLRWMDLAVTLTVTATMKHVMQAIGRSCLGVCVAAGWGASASGTGSCHQKCLQQQRRHSGCVLCSLGVDAGVCPCVCVF
jgi:hypothetical protein